MNFKAYNYVSNTIFDNFNEIELYSFFKYLLQKDYTPMTIFECLRNAKKFIEEEKTNTEREKLKELKIEKQADYGDLLCL